MPDLFGNLFSAGDFLPHGHCYLWEPGLVWLHVVSDSLIALAYLSIPVSLGYFVRRRSDLPFAWMFWAFGIFIISCGTTHAMEVLTLWNPVYWLSGSIKALTATASVTTAALLVPLVPRALAIPSPGQLRRAHEELRRSEARFRAATEGMRDAFYILESVRDGTGNVVDFRVAEMNDAAKEWLGLGDAKDGRMYSDIARRRSNAMSHDAMVRVLESKRMVEQERRLGEGKDPSGWVREQLVALGDGLAITVRQITDEKRHQEAIAHLAAIVESTAEAIIGTTVDGTIASWNAGAERLYGYAAAEAIGKHASLIVPEELREEQKRILASVGRGESASPSESVRVHKNGKKIDVFLTASPMRNEHGDVIGISTIAHDITERKTAEKAVAESLHEKEVLLREIHHRVKNNLQVISSLLKLHAEQITDPVARAVFQDSQERVRSIALLHDKLYQSGSLGGVDVGYYAETLVQTLLRAHGLAAAVTKVRIEAGGIHLPVGAALPCGLIINELVTNSLKHAFAPDQEVSREIQVRMGIDGEDIELAVEDNGVGLPTGFDINGARTLGMHLVRMFARQLGGKVEFSREAGTRWTVRFPRRAGLEG